MNPKLLSGALGLAITVGLVATTGTFSQPDKLSPTGIEELHASSNTELPIRSGSPTDVLPMANTEPISLRIGDINLDASVVPVGVDEKQRLDVPSADTVGWYQYSAAPGGAGATVLAAHVDFAGKQGAFFHLHELESDDLVELIVADGTSRSYQVISNSTYNKSQLPADNLFRKDGEPVLQLITCGGTFDPENRSYDANVVITAQPI